MRRLEAGEPLMRIWLLDGRGRTVDHPVGRELEVQLEVFWEW
ncbi:hypothetical protein [Calidithermus roseus]|uniref:Uncharacterized protein n=1 Tax=Calidithermus roseus TaxID=1644118 RepID=A0A399F2W1_9DEIN|nr:hypothetical protein [Calidithermus roseus]RIH89629.1 hypothetical protein Mrose_00218 [Calidithermus roseus]